MNDEQLFIEITYDNAKHRRKRGMPTDAPDRPKPGLSTNDLTKTIIKYLNARGQYAVRINVLGIYDEKKQQWRKSTTERGTADIHACINGKHVSIEVKRGQDRMSDQQKIVQEKIEHSGGIYLTISEFVDFHIWYRANITR